MNSMTARERVIATIKREVPDRVPHFEFAYDSPIIKALTKNGTYDDLIDLLDIDAVMSGANYARKPIGENLSMDEWGVTQMKGAMEHTIPLDDRSPIKTMEDLQKWNPPDPNTPDRLSSFEKLVKRHQGKRAIFVYVRDVWSLPRDLMGYMDLMIACVSKPEVVTGIIEKGVEHNMRIVERAVKLGAELVFTGDDIADNHNTLISPKMWEELFAPHFRRLVAFFHSLGLYHWKHSDGNLMPVMESLIDAGIDGIDPIDPLGGMTLKSVKEKYGKKVAIKGNVDCVNTLVHGTREEVIAEVKQCIKTAGPGGGYVCSSSNSIHHGVNPELYKTMVEAIHQFGAYPLDLNILSD